MEDEVPSVKRRLTLREEKEGVEFTFQSKKLDDLK